MPRNPSSWGHSTWLLAVVMSMAGGIVNWYANVRKGYSRVCNIAELVGEIFTAAFVGIGVFMLAAALDQPEGICAAFAGIGGHMGSRLLFIAERWLESAIERMNPEKENS
jgi:hypothetical protein